MSFLDNVVPSKPILEGQHKYCVKGLNDPIPFGKYKGRTLAELNNSARNWLLWSAKEELFGPESFWDEETMNQYMKCLEKPPEDIDYRYYGDDGIYQDLETEEHW